MLPYRSEPADRPWLAALGALAVVHALLIFGFGWLVAGGHFVLPADPAYLQLRSAEMLSQGQLLRLHPTSRAAVVAENPLWMLALTPLFWLKIQGSAGALVALAGSVLAFAAAVAWVYQLVSRLSGCLAGAIAAGLLVANAHVVAQVVSADGQALFAMLLLGGILAAQAWWQEEDRRARAALVVLALLLPMAGPTGICFPFFVLLIGWLRRGDRHGPPVGWMLASVVPYLVWAGIVYATTSHSPPTDLPMGFWWARGDLPWSERLLLGANSVASVVELLRGQFGVLTALAAFGAFFLLASEWRSQRLSGGTLLAALWLAGLALEASRTGSDEVRLARLIPTLVLGFVLVGVSLRRLAQLFQQHEETGLKAMGGALLLATLAAAPGVWSAQARGVADRFALERRAAFLETGGTGAILTDAPGLMAYVTGRPVIDLEGATAAGLRRAALAGAGAFAEALAALPTAARPTVFLARNGDAAAIPGAETARLRLLAGDGMTALEIVPLDPTAPAEATLDLAPTEQLLLDVNVGALTSEAAARYDFVPAAVRGDGSLSGAQRLAMDDGTFVTGRWVREESFAFAPKEKPAKTTVLRARILDAVRQDVAGAAVVADAVTTGTLAIKDADTTPTVELPPTVVTAPMAPVEIPVMSKRVLRVVSEATGFAVERALPEGSEVEVPLGEMLEAAGGTSWRLIVTVPGEPDAVWFSARWWVVE